MPSAQSFICLIRGVNVGGNKLLKMEALRALCGSIAGVTGVKTYLQSGNVVFRSSLDRGLLTRRIEEGIGKATGFEAKVILRTASELRGVIAANPFPVPPRNPKALLVAFLGGEIGNEAKALLSKLKIESEELHVGGRELYLYMPDGIAGSKLSNALTEKKLGVNVTARNWNTVNALLEMAEEGQGT